VRIVSATHCDLEARIREGKFRSDLFYRLAVLRLQLPPLRERQADIMPLAEWSLKHAALAAMGARPHPNLHAEISSCTGLFETYPWPGNVREMRNMMERLALFLAAEPLQALSPAFVSKILPELSDRITTNETTKPSISPLAKRALPGMRAANQETLEEIMQRFGYQRDAVAAHLGISRTTLWRKLKQLQINDKSGDENHQSVVK
jgi:propionate catabolism operon transcriptional regulator